MPKFFVFSDIHGFYDEFVDALNKAGYDSNNKDNWLIGCGDYFDRGSQPLEIMEFLMATPRTILVKGNHETLMEEMLDRGYAQSHDISNGTLNTIYCLDNSIKKTRNFGYGAGMKIYEMIRPFYKKMLYYFETENYIFCHSWIPTDFDFVNRSNAFIENWRDCHDLEWSEAMWVNPFINASSGLNKTNKYIVSGHWHCSEYWQRKEKRSAFDDDAKWDIAIDEKNKHIGIDACTAYTKKINILVIEDNFLKEEEIINDCKSM